MWSLVFSIPNDLINYITRNLCRFSLVMSLTFTFTGNESVLSADIFPPVELEQPYEVGLLSFESYNSIPNVDSSNNKFHLENGKVIEIPEGTYEVIAIEAFLRETLRKIDSTYFIRLTTNNNTLQTTLRCTVDVDLTPENSIGRLLGLKPVKLKAGRELTTEGVVDIFKVNSVQVECNIATGSFINGRPAHTIYQFFPSVGAGFKLIEEPNPVIYSPVSKHTISNITLRITDQLGELVNFRGERITIRLHLRRI